jgi:CRISPR/Cas system-associated exonuclease Cas4 (RecB family)
MSKYYNPQRTRNIYDPASSEPFKLSRSKVDQFLNCPRCFYNDRRLGIGQPPGYPFSLNSAVDTLLKKEFDRYRELRKPHPLMVENGVDAIPFAHEKLEEWRDSLHHGVKFHHKKTNLIISGGIDDLWQTPNEELIIVDYKATAKNDAVSIDADWQIGYKRQMSLYAWLFKMNGFKIHRFGYFVYANGLMSKPEFAQKLEFDISVLPYEIEDSWVEDAIQGAFDCLNAGVTPEPNPECDHCQYHFTLLEAERGSKKS